MEILCPMFIRTWDIRNTSLEIPHSGTSLVVQWLRLQTSSAGGSGSIPGQGTKIPQAQVANCFSFFKERNAEISGCPTPKSESALKIPGDLCASYSLRGLQPESRLSGGAHSAVSGSSDGV